MRNLAKLLFVLSLIFAVSCTDKLENDVSLSPSSKEKILRQSEGIIIYEVNDETLSKQIFELFTQYSMSLKKMGISQGLSNIDIQDFDFNTIYKSVKNDFEGQAFSVNYKNTFDGKIIYSLVVFKNSENELLNPMLVKCVQGKSINYGLINSGQQVTIANDEGEVFSNVTTLYSNKSSKAMCGGAVASCIGDAYSNHGWASVYIFVQSAFIPQTAVAIAGYCAMGNCSR